jgi:putative oxidoreductase
MTSLYAGLDRWSPHILAILRIVTALLFIQHGTQKFFSFPIAGPASLPTLYIIQGLIEFVGGILLLLGAFTRIVAFIMSGDMAAAYFMSHYPKSFYPIENGGDLAILFCFVFLYFFFAGPGSWSLDRNVLSQEA